MIDEALGILRRNNYKVTKQRQSMLEYLSNFQHHFIEVTQVDAYLRQLYPGVSHNTIYRNIEDFTRMGILEAINRPTGKCVKYQCDFQNHHHHFICKKCERVQEIAVCPFDEQVKQQLAGCTIESHVFEIYGICAQCNARLKKETERS